MVPGPEYPIRYSRTVERLTLLTCHPEERRLSLAVRPGAPARLGSLG